MKYLKVMKYLKRSIFQFLNNEITRTHSLPSFFIRINKGLTCINILIT